MRKRWIQTGLKNKLVIGGVAILAVVTAVILAFVILRQREQMRQYLEQKAAVVARIAAQSASVGLVFDDVESVKSELEVVEVSPDVRFAAVYRPDGTLFTSHGDVPAAYGEIAKRHFAADQVVMASLQGGTPDSCTALQAVLPAMLATLPALPA